MPNSLQIINWSETFETAKTRKLQRLAWYHHPSGSDSRGYRQLARLGATGFMALGVFEALCQGLATLRIDARKSGTFLNSDGTGMSMADVWEITRIPEEVGTLALPILQASGWISLPETNGRQTADHPPATDPPPASLQEEERREEKGKGEERMEEEGSGSGGTPDDLHTQAQKLINATPKPSPTGPTLQAATNCIRRHAGTIPFEEILEAIQLITATIAQDWTPSEKLKYIPTNWPKFFDEDLWRRHPDEWRSKQRPRSKRLPVDTGGRKMEILDLREN